jgi:sugar lactone lactonase YvrE
MKKRFVYGMVVFCLSFLLMSCKLTISSFTAPSTANTGEVITLTIDGSEDGTSGECGLVLQIPANWEVISAVGVVHATIDNTYPLYEQTRYTSLYTAPSGYKIWVGTADTPSSSQYSVTGTVKILTGRTPAGASGTSQNYNVKIAVGAFRNGAWVTDDPANVYDFSQITGDKYVKNISVTNVTDSVPPASVTLLTVKDYSTGTDVNLAWNGYDEATQKDVVKYRIYQSTANFTNVSGMAYVAEISAGTFSYDVSNLTPGTTHYFAVTALDEVPYENKIVSTVSVTPHRKVGGISGQSFYSDCTSGSCTNKGIAGAKITAQNNSLSNIRTTATSDSAGNYTFSNLPIGSYNITIEAYGYRTTGYSVTVVENQTVPNPSALIATQIGLSGNLAFGNVYAGSTAIRTLTISNVGTSALTVSSVSCSLGFTGDWSGGTIPAGSSQNVTITFAPTAAKSYSGSVSVSSSQPSDYNSIPISGLGIKSGTSVYTISGSVKISSGAGISGVTMTLNTGGTATTDSSGNYSFSNIAAGSGGTVTPSKSGYIFTPASQTFSNISANQTLNFIGAVYSEAPPVYVMSFGSKGTGNGQFDRPQGIAIDSSGNIYVADSGNSRIQKLDSAGNYLSQFGSSGSGNGQFLSPRSITIDSSGNIYVADANNRIQKFSSSGTYLSQFGTAGSGNGQFYGLHGIAIDSSGNIYVADSGNNRIQKFSSSGTYQSQFGTAGSGNGQFYGPDGIAIDISGNIYVADSGNSRIQKFSSSGTYQSQFGSYGTGNGQFYGSDDIAIDSSGNIYVLDYGNNRIQKFNSAGVYQSQFGTNGSGDGQFLSPSGMAIDSSGNIYVSDDVNNRIQKWSPVTTNYTISGSVKTSSGVAISGVTMTLSTGATAITDSSGNYSFSNIAAGSSGTVTPSKSGLSFTPSSQSFSNISANQTLNFIGAVPATQYTAVFQAGTGGTVSPSGSQTVSSGGSTTPVTATANSGYQFVNWKDDSGSIVSTSATLPSQTITANRIYTAYFQSSGTVYYTISGSVKTSSGTAISGVTMTLSSGITATTDSSGNYSFSNIAAGSGGTVTPSKSGLSFTPSSQSFSNISANQTLNFIGSVYSEAPPIYVMQFGTSGTGNGQFSWPFDVAVDSSGNIYVSDSPNNRVQKFSSSGIYLSQFGTYGSGNGQLSNPDGIAVDSFGNIYVTEPGNSRVQKFSSSGTYLSQFGTYGSGNGQFNYPYDVAIDSSDNIYVADYYNKRIQKFSSSGTYLSQFGTSGSGNGQFNSTDAITIDSSGNIYVADGNNNRIQKFSSSGTYLSQFGTYGSGNGQFNVSTGVAADSSGNIYVADYNNNRIQKFSSSGTYLSQFGTYGSGNGQFIGPGRITIDSSGNIYVADTQNKRIQKFSPNSSGFIISGSVKTSSGAGISGVTMTLSTGAIATTDSSGNYSFTNIAAGSGGTVTPSKSGLSFTPSSQSFSNISANQTLNFTGYVPVTQYTAVFQAGTGGYISSGSTSQTVSSGSSTTPVTAAANSGYTFVNWKDDSGNIVSTSATLSSQTITANRIYTAYFQSSGTVYYTISGSVKTAAGAAISGVLLMPNTGRSATTDSNGNYTLSVVSGWTGKVYPSKSGYTFSSSLSYSNVKSNQTNQNYVGAVQTPTSYTVSGSVSDSNNTGISGVTMTFSNSGGTTSTDETGFYSKSVSSGWSGTLTPSKTGCTFTPASQSFSSVTTNRLYDFSADCGETNAWITRSLPASYMPGGAFTVTLKATPPSGTMSYLVEDKCVNGWIVSNISNSGLFDANTQKVKFGPFQDGVSRTLTYTVTPPSTGSGDGTFTGAGIINTTSTVIGGQAVISKGLQMHPADTNANFIMTGLEMNSYLYAWLNFASWTLPPNPIPMEYVSKAIALWQHGETYKTDTGKGSPPLCWVNTATSARSERDNVSLTAVRQLPSTPYASGTAITVMISISASTTGYTVEDALPAGWTASSVSSGGTTAGGIVRFGIANPGGDAKILTYQATPPAGATGTQTFSGKVVMEDVRITIAGNQSVSDKAASPGDLDNSGTVDLTDAIIALRILAGIDVGSVPSSADVNGDNKIGLPEVIYILQKVGMLK